MNDFARDMAMMYFLEIQRSLDLIVWLVEVIFTKPGRLYLSSGADLGFYSCEGGGRIFIKISKI